MSIQVDPSVQFVAGGAVQAGDGVYVRRAADEMLLRACHEGEFAYVLTSRQMGKSSLMNKVAEQLKAEGIVPVVVDLSETGVEVTADQWYYGIADIVADQLQLDSVLKSWWEGRAILSPSQRLTQFLSNVVLTHVSQPLVIFVDEIDTTLRLDFTDDFFASIRYLYNARAQNQSLRRLSFVLLGAASPSELIKDRTRTPFNIGRRIDLRDFEEADAIRDLGVDPDLAREVFQYTCGQPYLTLRVLRSIADDPLGPGSLSDLVRARIQLLFYGDQMQGDSNLPQVRETLLKLPGRNERLRRYRAVLLGQKVPDDEADPVCSELLLTGVVRSGHGQLHIKNQIYPHIFDRKWVQSNLKFNWQKLNSIASAAAAVLALVFAVFLAIQTHRVAVLNQRFNDLVQSLQKTMGEKVGMTDAQKQLIQNLQESQDELRNGDYLAASQHIQELTLEQKNQQLRNQLEQQAGQAQADLQRSEEQQRQVLVLQQQRDQSQIDSAKADAAHWQDQYIQLEAKQKQPQPPPPQPPIAPKIVFYTPPPPLFKKPKELAGMDPRLLIDFDSYAIVSDRTHFTVQLPPTPPGTKHQFCVSYPVTSDPCDPVEIDLGSGQDRYIKIVLTFRNNSPHWKLSADASLADMNKVAPNPIPDSDILNPSRVYP